MNTEYIVFMSDLHCGDAYGLLNPATKLEYDGPGGKPDIHAPTLTEWQKAIWGILTDAIKDFGTQTNDAPVVLVVGGDVVQGTRYLTHQVTAKRDQQMQIAMEAIQYIFGQLNIRRVFLAYGTEAHVGIDGEGESGIVPLLDHPNRPVVATPMARVRIGGGDVSIVHHGYYVGDAYLRGNAGRLMLQRRMMDDINLLGVRPPALHLSGHVHKYAHYTHVETLGGEDIESHAIVCPALCPLNGYARQITKSQPILSTGLVLIKMQDGKVAEVNRDHIHYMDMRHNYGYDDGGPGLIAHPYEGSPRKHAG